jgi:hypothetical protein
MLRSKRLIDWQGQVETAVRSLGPSLGVEPPRSGRAREDRESAHRALSGKAAAAARRRSGAELVSTMIASAFGVSLSLRRRAHARSPPAVSHLIAIIAICPLTRSRWRSPGGPSWVEAVLFASTDRSGGVAPGSDHLVRYDCVRKVGGLSAPAYVNVAGYNLGILMRQLSS